jgi:hypothetical protein
MIVGVKHVRDPKLLAARDLQVHGDVPAPIHDECVPTVAEHI